MQDNREKKIESNNKEPQKIKCVIWDLDHTIWNGILLEDKQVVLNLDVVNVIRILDNRGILNSIASKNDYKLAIDKLEQFGIKQYFLYPQLNWNSKVSSIKIIADALKIDVDTLAFVDDQLVERKEVAFSLPQVLCLGIENIGAIVDLPRMQPLFVTKEASMRREMYISDIKRDQAEALFREKTQRKILGSSEEFLASLDMHFSIASMLKEDLHRAEELIVRTNQLNSTGYIYSYDELDTFRQSDVHQLLIAGLDDKFGTYGKIGLALVVSEKDIWTINLLLLSCRVLARGVLSVFLLYIIHLANDAHTNLRAEFNLTDRNYMLYNAYKSNGFKEIKINKNSILLEYSVKRIHHFPQYIKIHVP